MVEQMSKFLVDYMIAGTIFIYIPCCVLLFFIHREKKKIEQKGIKSNPIKVSKMDAETLSRTITNIILLRR